MINPLEYASKGKLRRVVTTSVTLTFATFGLIAVFGGGGFPTQFFGLRAQKTGSIIDLCLVAEADAPSGMGGVIKIDKNGTLYAVYLVEVGDGNASPIRIKTTTGIKSIRLKT